MTFFRFLSHRWNPIPKQRLIILCCIGLTCTVSWAESKPLLTVADLNGDGFSDWIRLNANGTGGIYFNPGTLIPKPSIPFSSKDKKVRTIAASDLSGDGKPELLLLYPQAGGCEVLWSPNYDSTQTTILTGLGADARAIQVGGKPTLRTAIGFNGDPGVVFLTADRAAPFLKKSGSLITVGQILDLQWLDWDGDGDGVDELILLQKEPFPAVRILHQEITTPPFNQWQTIITLPVEADGDSRIQAGWVDRNPNPDVLVWSANSTVTAFLQDDSGTIQTQKISLPESFQKKAIDVNGDSLLDCIVISSDQKNASLFLNNGNLTFTEKTIPNLSGIINDINVGYFTQTQSLELLVWTADADAEGSDGQLSIYRLSGNGAITTASVGTNSGITKIAEGPQNPVKPSAAAASYENVLIYKKTDLDAGNPFTYQSFHVDDWTLGGSFVPPDSAKIQREVLQNGIFASAPDQLLTGITLNGNLNQYAIQVNQPAADYSFYSFGSPKIPQRIRLTISPPGGTYNHTVQVIPYTEPGASIYYRINGGAWNLYTPGNSEIIFYAKGTASFYAQNGAVFSPTFDETYVIQQAPTVDSDNDGIPDALETAMGLSIFSQTFDFDGDGWNDLDEAIRFSNPKDENSIPQDSDQAILPGETGDGWSDFDENLRHTNPFDPKSAPVAPSIHVAEYLLHLESSVKLTGDNTSDNLSPGSSLAAWSVGGDHIASATLQGGSWEIRLSGLEPLLLRIREIEHPTLTLLGWSPSLVPCWNPALLYNGSQSLDDWLSLLRPQTATQFFSDRSEQINLQSTASALAFLYWLGHAAGLSHPAIPWGVDANPLTPSQIAALQNQYDFDAVYAYFQSNINISHPLFTLVQTYYNWAGMNPPLEPTDITLEQLLWGETISPQLLPNTVTADVINQAIVALNSLLAGIPTKQITLTGLVTLENQIPTIHTADQGDYLLDLGGAGYIIGITPTLSGTLEKCSIYGQPIVKVNTISNTQALLAFNNVDSDGDGIPDQWEQFYFGRTDAKPDEDPDHDNATNLEEYQNHTNPNNENSFPGAATPTPPAPTITPTPTPPVISTPVNTPTVTPTPTGKPPVGGNDEVVLAQGYGGNTLINVRNFDDKRAVLASILQSFLGAPKPLIVKIGGGDQRAAYVSTGDVNGDGKTDIVVTFGPITSNASTPNMVLPIDAATRKVIGHSFSAFPTGNGSPANYNGGEIRSAVGDFLGLGMNQIALAQGAGGNGIVRIYQFSGKPAPNGWVVKAQFDGLVGPAKTANAAGGVNIAAGDLNGDGKAELIVAQTNSPTSQTSFQVLEFNSAGGIVTRVSYAGFTPKFRGNGGLEVITADLNGDGNREIIVAGTGNTRNFGDVRDSAPINLIGVIQPIIQNGKITGFKRPGGAGTLSVMNEGINPSGALSIAAGELNGNRANGDELVIGTGAIIQVNGKQTTAVKPAPQSKYKIIKLAFDGVNVSGFSHVIGGNNGLNAFVGPFDPDSGAVFVGVGDVFK